jgi:outer membrane protein
MTNIFTVALITCFFVFPSVVFAADKPTEVKSAVTVQTARIGYVDIARIGTESERGKALKITLTARKDKLQAQIVAKKKQIEKLQKSIEPKIAQMTPQQRKAKSKEFQNKLEEFQKFARTSEEEFMALQEKESREFFEAMEQAAVELGKANGYAVIVAKKEMLYVGSSADAQDVTDALIKALNQAGQKK